jgi:hypothetical protein
LDSRYSESLLVRGNYPERPPERLEGAARLFVAVEDLEDGDQGVLEAAAGSATSARPE